jgi:hypothetical protein
LKPILVKPIAYVASEPDRSLEVIEASLQAWLEQLASPKPKFKLQCHQKKKKKIIETYQITLGEGLVTLPEHISSSAGT